MVEEGEGVPRIGATLALASLLLTGVVDAAAAQDRLPDLGQERATAERVLASDQVQEAFDYLEGAEEETVQEWLSVCNAYGPAQEEEHRSRLLYKLFRIYGLENVHIDDELNVIGVRPGVGEGPSVVLNAHHDNVALWPKGQPIEAFVADGRVWCPAAGDDLMGVTQMLTVLRALNAGDVETEGDLWFVGLTAEEPRLNEASPGSGHFVRSNVPHNIDWLDGDIMVQFHGGGGEGVSTGSTPIRHRSQLRVFTPFEWDRWRSDAVDAMARVIVRVGSELRDPRSTEVSFHGSGEDELTSDVLYLNMSRVEASPILNTGASETWIRFDLRAPTVPRLEQAHRDIQSITEDVLAEMGEGFDYHYSVNSRNGTETGIEGWDKLDNPPARMAAAAAQALYGTEAVIDSTRGCGDCVRAYRNGMPAMSLRGDVVDPLDGPADLDGGRDGELRSAVRRRTAGHDVTESAEIVELWSGVKHGLLFAVSYAGLARP